MVETGSSEGLFVGWVVVVGVVVPCCVSGAHH